MAQDILGIQATINGSDIQKGANEFISKIQNMEKATDKLSIGMRGNLDSMNKKLLETSLNAQKTGQMISSAFDSANGSVMQLLGAFGISLATTELVRSISSIRGEFQQLEVAFTTMLGSKEKANNLMSELVSTAAKTPFDLQGIANGAKQLLAYGTASEEVNDTLIHLGDIAAGLSLNLNDLVWLYGTTMTQGRLFSQDFNQFLSRGIPLADELAKQFGVTKSAVKELVIEGKVGFPEVQKAIIAMTSEGGKFGGLMNAQSKTITGQISNIQDAISSMYNEIGKQNEGLINSSLSAVSYIVEHWREVVAAIETAAVAYGSYKAALMATSALQGANQTLSADIEITGLQELLQIKEESKNADLAAAIASGKLTETKAAEVVMLREELAMKVATLEAEKAIADKEYASALLNMQSADERLKVAKDAVDGMDEWIARAEDLGDTELANTYRTQLAEKCTELQSAAIAQNSAQKALNDAATKKQTTTEVLNTVTTQANTIANNANTASIGFMKLAMIQLTTVMKGLWVTMMANPLMLLASSVAALGFAVYKLATMETAAEKVTKDYNNELEEVKKKHDEYKEKIQGLNKTIEDNNESEGKRIAAFQALKEEYKNILPQMLTEAEYLKEIAKYKKLIAGEDERRAKADDEAILKEQTDKLNRMLYLKSKGQTSYNFLDIDEAIKAQYNIIGKQKIKVSEHDVTNYLGGLKDLKDEDIASVIEEISMSLRVLEKEGDNAMALVSEIGGEFSKSQLSTIKNALETEQKSRSGKKLDSKGWLKQYKVDYEAAQKELDDFMKSKSKLSEEDYAKRLKELTEKKDEAEKKYKGSGGVTGSKKNKEEQLILKAQEQLNKQFLSLQRKNQQDEVNLMAEGAEKKKAQADLDFQNALDTLESQEKEWRKAQNGKLTDEQKNELSKFDENAYKNYEKTVKEITKSKTEADKRAWQEYYIAYGEYQEKRKAIEEKYNDELSKVEKDSPQYATLIAQRKKELDDLDETLMKDSGLWGDFFSDFSNRSSSVIKSLIVDIQELIDYMSGVEGAQIPSIFKDDENVIKSINEAMSNPEAAQKFVKNLQGSLGKFKKMVEKDNPFELLSKGFKEKDSKSLEDGLNGIAAAASEVGNIMEGLGVKSDSALGKTTSAISSTASMAAQGAAIGGPWGAAAGAAVGLATSLVGMFGADYSSYNKMKEEYDSLIDVWDTLIDKKREYIDISYGDEARKAGNEAIDLLNKKSQSNRVLGAEFLNAGSSAGSHSIGVRQRKGMSSQGWEELRKASQTIGFDYNSVADGRMTGLFELSVEQLKKLQEEAPTFWAKLNVDVRGYLQNIIDCEDEIEEMKKQMNETLTGISFDSFYDGFVSMLSDMSKSGKDMADDFGENIKNAILSNLVSNNYRKKIEDLYNEWAKKSDSNGDEIFDLDQKEAEELKKAQKSLIEQMIAERDALAEAFGWTDSAKQQEASRGFGTEMTHEDAGELSGRFTAVYEAILQQTSMLQLTQQDISTINRLITLQNESISEIVDIQTESVGYLSEINKNTKQLYQINERLGKIEANTKNL